MKSIYKTLRLADARYADSVVGSPDYMAIETLRGQTYSYSVDYWSLGCILFECVRPASRLVLFFTLPVPFWLPTDSKSIEG